MNHAIQLIINNSFSEIKGLTPNQFKQLKDLLSYEIDAQEAYFSGNYLNKKRSLLGKRGDFPSGLLYLVEAFLKNTPYTRLERRQRPNVPIIGMESLFVNGWSLFVNGWPLKPYAEQLEAVAAVLEKDRGIISAVTGLGKSFIIGLLIDSLKVKTLVVVPTVELKKQLSDTLLSWFGEDNYNKYVTVENVAALNPDKKATQDLVIIDEFHHSAAKTYRMLNQKAWTNVYYRVGLTATPFRTNDNERLLLESLLSEVIYRVDYKTAVQKGYIVPVEAFYVDLLKTHTDKDTYPGVYSELVVNNDSRNDIIANLLQKFHVEQISTLCLVKEIEHGETLSKLTGGAFMHGQDEESRQFLGWFNDKRLKILIGTNGVLGEGVDTRPAEVVIIAGLGKSKTAFMQQVGRAVRAYPGKQSCKVIVFRDPSHKYTLSHFRTQCKILRDEYAVIPKKLKI